MAFAAPAYAEDMAPPAVSAPNMKVDLSGGSLSGGPAALAGFTGTVPVGHSFGLQVDGALGVADEDPRGGVAGHFFYRDPRSFMLGATAMWSKITGPNDDAESKIRRVGLEAEIYLGDFSILPTAGVQNAHGDATGYGSLGGVYYLTDSLALGTSVSGSGNSRALQVGGEYKPSVDLPVSFMLDTGMDNKGPAFVLAGVRFSFGAPSRTLKERDRFDDPGNIVTYMNTTAAGAITSGTAHTPKPTPKAVGAAS
ncbi:MAG: hypothetical protein K2X44_04800 [Magnetospirillum sp.]|nr:hypothetical protein [Magnetospirillum sp.]